MGKVKNYYWEEILKMSHHGDEDYWDIRFEQALEYLNVCGFKAIDLENSSDIILEDARGNRYHHTTMEIMDFHNDGITPILEDEGWNDFTRNI